MDGIRAALALGILLATAWPVAEGACGNKHRVRSGILSEHDKVFWGDEIDHLDQVTGVAAVVADFLGGGGTFTAAWVEDQINQQIRRFGEIGEEFVVWLADNPDKVRDVVVNDLKVTAVFRIATYMNEACTCSCCRWQCGNPLGVPCTGCSCSKCGELSTDVTNTHQPYVGLKFERTDGQQWVSPDDVRLSAFHSGCNSIHASRTPECVAAMHRYCASVESYDAGVSREVGSDEFGVLCFNVEWYGDVRLADLQTKHGGCQLGISQSDVCMSAVHRWCADNGKGTTGLTQEVGDGVFGVACFDNRSYQDVAISVLQGHHGDCNAAHKSQDAVCIAATSRWCGDNGGAPQGLPQEVGNGVFGVACIPTDDYVYRGVKV